MDTEKRGHAEAGKATAQLSSQNYDDINFGDRISLTAQ